MRSFAAISALAGVAAASYYGGYGNTETQYSTTEVTITSCGPEVTNCPGSSTYPSTTPVYTQPTNTYPVSSSTPYTTPVYTHPTNTYPVSSTPYTTPYTTSPVYSSPIYSSPVYTPTYPASCPSAVTVTVTVPAGPSNTYPTGGSNTYPTTPATYTSSGYYPTGSSTGGYTPYPTNSYPSHPTYTSPPVNAGGKVQAGVFVAAAGAIAAFFL